MKFFFDNCISPKIVEFIKDLFQEDYELVHLTEKFSASTKDPVWINQLGMEGDWILITGDVRIKRAKPNKRALRESKLTAFVFPNEFSNLKIFQQIGCIALLWPKIIEKAVEFPPKKIFDLPKIFKIIDKLQIKMVD